MSIKRKKPLAAKLVYRGECEQAGRGLYCTGKCSKPKISKGKKSR